MTSQLSATPLAHHLDAVLGDPFDADNPFGADAVLAADERGALAEGAEAALDAAGLDAAFVPVALGGTLSSVPDLIAALRPVFARDCALGLGYGVTTLMAGLNVWTSGTAEQQAEAAGIILGHGKISVAYHELDHGNDFSGNEMAAAAAGAGYRLTGRKEVINNAARARAAVVFARTDEQPGRAHSLFLVDLANKDQPVRLPRYSTTALRGVQLGGFDFDGLTVPDTALLGTRGGGAEIALRSFQISRTVMASAALGPVDTALHIASAFAAQRVLHGRRVDTFSHARTNLALARALLLATDAAVTAVANRLHSDPAGCAAQTAAVKYLAPQLLEQAMEYLAIVLGARFYLRQGPFALFNKHFRDIAPVGIGHAGGTSCLLSILPQLPRLVRDREVDPAELARALAPGASTPTAVPFDQLTLRTPGGDPLLAALPEWLSTLRADTTGPAGLATLRELDDSIAEFTRAASELAPADMGIAAPATALVQADRYSRLLTIAAASTAHLRERDGFTGAWTRLAIAAIQAQARGVRPDIDPADVDIVVDEGTFRTARGQGFGLDPSPVVRSIPAL